MKNLNLIVPAILFAFFTLVLGCSKKESNDPAFTGNYVINSAQSSEALVIPTVQAGNVSLPVGMDITQLIRNALLGAVNCSSSDKAYVELRKDYSLYLSCEGANSLNAGTWSNPSPTSLVLNMNSTAIPESPSGMTLTVTGIVTTQAGWTGTTSVPLSKDMISAILAGMQMTLSPAAPDIFMVKFNVEFSKK